MSVSSALLSEKCSNSLLSDLFSQTLFSLRNNEAPVGIKSGANYYLNDYLGPFGFNHSLKLRSWLEDSISPEDTEQLQKELSEELKIFFKKCGIQQHFSLDFFHPDFILLNQDDSIEPFNIIDISYLVGREVGFCSTQVKELINHQSKTFVIRNWLPFPISFCAKPQKKLLSSPVDPYHLILAKKMLRFFNEANTYQPNATFDLIEKELSKVSGLKRVGTRIFKNKKLNALNIHGDQISDSLLLYSIPFCLEPLDLQYVVKSLQEN